MKKADTIKKIKAIIKEHGCFSVGEIEEEVSPCFETMGKMVSLAEEFFDETVKINVYKPSSFSSDPIDDFELPYEELSGVILTHILKLANKYKELQAH